MNNRNIFVIIILAVLFSSCSDLFEPTIENIRNRNTTYLEPNFGLNLLTNAYNRIPTNNWSFNDVATDDAVSNDINNNGYLKLATGQWSASNNAVDQWINCNVSIQYINLFLNEVDKMKFSETSSVNIMFKDRLSGEAYGLRALMMYHLLQAHAGWVNGKLFGFPIFLTELTSNSDFNLARATFDECVAQINKDIDKAQSLLPYDYTELTAASTLPTKYASITGMNYSIYNTVFGFKFQGLMSGRIAQVVRAQAALLAASPAFAAANGSTGKWEDAAIAAAGIIATKPNGTGLAGLPTYPAEWFVTDKRWTWYNNDTEIKGIANGSLPTEILWRGGTFTNHDIETANFPPSLTGQGRVNPTQNLVDAFPDKNGYPITSSSSVYLSSTPYINRDPRLTNYIVVQGTKVGPNNVVIDMATGNNAPGGNVNATRTGYYMRKLLRQDASNTAGALKDQIHYKPRVRYTEIYLIYAEAANEAWGPLADPKGYGYTAYDVIKAIRKRAMGLASDPYLESIKSDQAQMKQLIRNERRLELCFEGFRFWDLRRWKVALSELSAPVYGVTISGNATTFTVNAPTVVETRQFSDVKYYYGPIPYIETLKWSNLLQNDGWK
jgi:hypothetical protein